MTPEPVQPDDPGSQPAGSRRYAAVGAVALGGLILALGLLGLATLPRHPGPIKVGLVVLLLAVGLGLARAGLRLGRRAE